MRKFEYQTVEPNKLALEHEKGQRGAVDLLNDLGAEGWQLIMINNIWKDDEEWLMMRELPSEE